MPEFGTWIEGTRKSPLPVDADDERRRAQVHVADHFARDESVTGLTDELSLDVLETLRCLGLADDPLERRQTFSKQPGPPLAERWPLNRNWVNPNRHHGEDG